MDFSCLIFGSIIQHGAAQIVEDLNFLMNQQQVFSISSWFMCMNLLMECDHWFIIDIIFNLVICGSRVLYSRFIVGMERHSYKECGFFPGHGNNVNGTWSLCAYMEATWHGIQSSGCSPFPEHTCKYFCKYFILFAVVYISESSILIM